MSRIPVLMIAALVLFALAGSPVVAAAAPAKTLDNLMTFPCVRILVERGKLKLHAAYFGVSTGALSIFDPASGDFRDVGTEVRANTFSAPQF